MHKEVTRSRHIRDATKLMLWAKAAGRCQFAGHNLELWKHPETQEPVNIAANAHIHAFSAGGARYKKSISSEEINNIDNLMLVCAMCHKTIDNDVDGTRYSADLLRSWKNEHEIRVATNTGVHPHKRSHVLLYGAKIHDTDPQLEFNDAALAMFPHRYPAPETECLRIPPTRSWPRDRDQEFWKIEHDHLVKMFDKRVRQRIEDQEVKHVSVFGLAPQPLLVRLGTLLTDVNAVEVYPRSKEPQGWGWRRHPSRFGFTADAPKKPSGPPALVLSLSATVADERILDVLGGQASIWRVSISNPHNDFLRSRKQLAQFRETARKVMVGIKDMHGHKAVLNVFMAAPAAIAVELGRIRATTGDLRWQLWDQVRSGEPFLRALAIN